MNKNRMDERNIRIAEAYSEDGKTLDDIAEQFDLSTYRVRAILADQKVELKSASRSKKTERNLEIASKWLAGEPVEALADEYGLSTVRLCSLIVLAVEEQRLSLDLVSEEKELAAV